MNIKILWLRDLFRYSLAVLSSILIVLYFIFSFLSAILGDKYSKNLKTSLSKTLIESSLNIEDLNQNTQFDYQEVGLKRLLNSKENKILKVALNKKINNTNQFLWNNFSENSNKETIDNEFRNQFNIDNIISDLNLQKEKRVSVIAKELWIDRGKEKWDFAKLAWIQWTYNWSLDQNMKIRDYLIYNAKEIYKEKHWWNEWDTLPLITKADKEVKLNSKEITWQVTYNDVTLKVTAPIESFPEWTVLKIKTLGDDDSMTTFDITLKEVTLLTQVNNVELDAPMASFDISFYAPDDTEFINELQPAEWKYVSVTFDYTNSDEFKIANDEWFLAVYHMEETDYTSFANLVEVKGYKEKKESTKSDSIDIYANTLSVYILTIVSDLNEENGNTIMFDASAWGFILDDENIILSSTSTTSDIITWKIVSKDNTITLPNIQLSWYNFWWWYRNNIFIWSAWDPFILWNSNNSEKELELYACTYMEWISQNTCSLSEDKKSIEKEELVWPIESVVNQWEENTREEALYEDDINMYTPPSEEIKKYGQEMFDAYNRAINNWITTINDINKAKLNTNITRGELAKMMVIFMSWVLQKEPIITGSTVYKDVNKKKLWDLTDYIQLAYQYQIMWINTNGTPMENFNPNKPVSRWEFATILSRVLYGDMYNQNWKNYYEKHIKALNNANIFSDTNPNLTEWRWWVITMLYRTTS